MNKNRFYMILMGVLFFNVTFFSASFGKLPANADFNAVKRVIKNGEVDYLVIGISRVCLKPGIASLGKWYVKTPGGISRAGAKTKYGLNAVTSWVGGWFSRMPDDQAIDKTDAEKEMSNFVKDFIKGDKLSTIQKKAKSVWEDHCKEYAIYREFVELYYLCKAYDVKLIGVDIGLKRLYKNFSEVFEFDEICGTDIQIEDGKATGIIKGRVCSGQEKKRQVLDAIATLVAREYPDDGEYLDEEVDITDALEKTMFVFCSPNDARLAKEVGMPVVVNAVKSKKLEKLIKTHKWPSIIWDEEHIVNDVTDKKEMEKIRKRIK